MGVHVFPISHLPPYPIHLGHPSAPALSTLSHASNLNWQSVSRMIIYMFQFQTSFYLIKLNLYPWNKLPFYSPGPGNCPLLFCLYFDYCIIRYLSFCNLLISCASLVAQLVKNLPAMQENPVWFLGQEDPLEKGQATHSSIPGLPLWFSE